jgi:hypothetical protein
MSWDHYPYPHGAFPAGAYPARGGFGLQAQGYSAPGGYGAAGHYGPGYGAWPAGSHPASGPRHAQDSSLFGLTNERFLKGLLVGAAAAYLLTNDSVQRNAIKAVVKVWSVLQGGVEEIKERFHDAEAELRASEGASGP